MGKTRLWWIIAALAALVVVGCDDGDGGGGADAPDADVRIDHPAATDLRLNEQGLTATSEGQTLRVGLPLERLTGAAVSGTATVELLMLSDGTPGASGSAAFDFDAQESTVFVNVPFAMPTDQGLQAGYVLRYHITGGQTPLMGRRSLYTAAPKSEVQLLSADRFLVDGATHLRVLARDPVNNAPLAEMPVVVRFIPIDGEPTTLFEGQTDQFGALAAPITVDEALIGAGQLEVEASTPGAAQVLSAQVEVARQFKVMVTTDKPIYQPGQIIHLRALTLRKPTLAPQANADLVFEIYDGKQNKVERKVVETDAFGVAAMTFQLAREVNMGSYRIVTTIDDVSTEKVVTVSRYALPKFDLDVELSQAVYLAGDQMNGVVRARYFFGQSVQGGTVAITAATLDAGRTVFAEVQGSTNDEGLFSFELQLPDYIVGLPLEQGGGLVELGIEVTDAGGQARSIVQTVRIARAPLEVVVVPESGALVMGLENRLLVRTVNALGAPVQARCDVRIDDVPFPDEVLTDADGLARLVVRVETPSIEVWLGCDDADELRVESTFALGASQTDAAASILLRTDRALYRVGDTLEVDVSTIGVSDRVYLDVIREGQTLRTQMLEPDDMGRATLSFDLGPDEAGALQIDAYFLAQGSSLRRDSKLVYVEAANSLRVQITPDREVYAPGEEAILSFQVTDAEGVGQVAALGVQIVDEAVFALTELRPGLEKVYFILEGALAEPSYQIGVPSLAAVAMDPNAVDSDRRQGEAEMLFAATPPSAAYPVSINSFSAAQVRAQGLAGAAVIQTADGWFDLVQQTAQLGEWDEARIQVFLGELPPPADPWGRPMTLTVVEQMATLASSGLDEIWDTDDDLSQSISTWNLSFQQPTPDGGAVGGEEWDNAGPEADGDGVGEQNPPSDDGDGAGPPRVRRDFPETLLVQPSLITNPDGTAELVVPLADSITTWRVSALGNSRGGLLGSTDQGIRVFQDFFVDIDFPATLTRGDVFAVPVVVYNYLDTPQTVRLEVEAGDWLTLLGDAEVELELGPNEVAGVRVPVQVDRVGTHELTVFAYGDTLQDAVARAVRVVPDGQEVRRVQSSRMQAEQSVQVTLPMEAIEGSGKLLVKIYPGVFAQVVEGLEGILRMPGGCFEQTSASTWPNVQVARYLRSSEAPDPALDAQAMGFINTGYQRLLTFEVEGGGFEWFGNVPANTVLTAYGLLEFHDMAEVRMVDEAMMARTRAWLVGEQQADGNWIVQRGYDEAGQLTDPGAVTAYVAFGLAAAGEDGDALVRARAYLEPRRDDMGTYTLALFANFMVAWRPADALTTSLLDELAARIVEEMVGGDEGEAVGHWDTDEQTMTYGQNAAVETTSLATHALLAAGAHAEVSQPALDWLVTQKDSHGAWGSTASTVWTIKCLLLAAEGAGAEGTDAVVEVMLDGEVRGHFEITEETADVMRQVDLSDWRVPGQAQTVSLTLAGEGRLMYGVVDAHHMPWADAPAPEGPLSIDVSYDRTQLAVDDTVEVTVTIENRDETYADMVMVDLGIPPGFDLVRADLDALAADEVFRRYEATSRQLLLYFERVETGAPVVFSYHLIARNPIEAQAPASRIYSYYNEDVGAEAEPVDFEVE